MPHIEQPDTPEALARVLADASRQKRTTVIRGGGTKSDWARPADDADLELRTGSLKQLIAHRHGDLTATVQSGMTLAAFNAALAAHQQWLPVESAFAGATIGGILATNDSGPLRYRMGTPRDLLIGITLALTDGRLVKAGGHVVKNVAGYDLGKLVTGSHGSLAAIVDATFKLMPLPRASATMVATYVDPAQMARDVASLAASQLEPMAFDLRSDLTVFQLFARFASSPAATNEQINDAKKVLSGGVSVLTGEAEAAMWAEQVRWPWSAPSNGELPTVLRASWLPSKLVDVIAELRDMARDTATSVTLIARASGAGFVRLSGAVETHSTTIGQLRATKVLRNVVVLRAPDSVKREIDVWGPPASAAVATKALKQMFDPNGILNAGRGPI
jgi:glycolate oxidase FAD binding subunit